MNQKKIYPKKISARKRKKLQKMFPLLPEEKEKILFKKQVRRENMISLFIGFFLILYTLATVYTIYLMLSYKV